MSWAGARKKVQRSLSVKVFGKSRSRGPEGAKVAEGRGRYLGKMSWAGAGKKVQRSLSVN